MKTILTKNPPERLLPLAQKWLNEGKSFYLGPENIFQYHNLAFLYPCRVELDRTLGSWYICTDDRTTPYRLELSCDELNEISDYLSKDDKPQVAMMFIGSQCNVKCGMCPYHGELSEVIPKVSKGHKKIVELELVKQRIDKVKAMGVQGCFISSHGEPILHPNWKEIYQYVDNLELDSSFISNGCMFTKEHAEFFGNLKYISWGTFSLHSNRFESWKKILGTTSRKFFENAMRAPVLAKKAGVRNVCVAMVVQEANKDEVDEFIGYWKNKVDRITISRRTSLDADTFENNNDFPIGLCINAHGNAFAVEPSGNIGACCNMSALPKEEYGLLNIDEDSIETILANLYKLYKNEKIMKNCQTCMGYKLSGQKEIINFTNGISGIKTGSSIDINRRFLHGYN